MIFEFQSSKKNNISFYNLIGELIDKNQAGKLLEDIENGIENNENKILLDLKDLRYLNSTGLNVIINILTKARKSGGDVAVCNVNKKINDLLIITKLNQVFNVCDSVEDATAVLTK